MFEGFGLSAAEAKALGKRVLLSDLLAHRELQVPGALYFDPNDVEDMSSKIKFAWESATAGPDSELEAAARQAQPARVHAFGRAFLGLAEEARESYLGTHEEHRR